MNNNEFFPEFKKGLEDFITEEEGNISRAKVLMIGSIMVVVSALAFGDIAYAKHRSHSSHSSHSSHRSGSGGHESHVSHQSHQSHQSGSGGNYYGTTPGSSTIPSYDGSTAAGGITGGTLPNGTVQSGTGTSAAVPPVEIPADLPVPQIPPPMPEMN